MSWLVVCFSVCCPWWLWSDPCQANRKCCHTRAQFQQLSDQTLRLSISMKILLSHLLAWLLHLSSKWVSWDLVSTIFSFGIYWWLILPSLVGYQFFGLFLKRSSLAAISWIDEPNFPFCPLSYSNQPLLRHTDLYGLAMGLFGSQFSACHRVRSAVLLEMLCYLEFH